MDEINQKRNKSSEYGFPNIPDEVVVEILLRVPAISLMRFKCVSKSWHALLSNHKFITDHVKLNRVGANKQPPPMKDVYICGLTRTKTWISSLATTTVGQLNKFSIPVAASTTDANNFIVRLTRTQILISSLFTTTVVLNEHPVPDAGTVDANDCVMRSCDGLICIFKRPNHIRLWNPATRKQRTLPLLSLGKKIRGFHFIGFGYYEPTNDYKVVVFQHDLVSRHEADCMLHVYSLNTHRWDSVKYGTSRFPRVPASTPGVFFNNKPYWLPNDDVGGIRCFDLASREFEEIKEPHGNDCVGDGRFRHFRHLKISIGVLDGHVCLSYDMNTKMDFWLLNHNANKEYTWTKFVSIKTNLRLLYFLPIFDKGEILTMVHEEFGGPRSLMLHDSQASLQRMLLEIPTNVKMQIQAIVFVKSLVSI